MKGNKLAILIVAPRPRSGATLLARAFADYFRLSHEHPLIFDTGRGERRLSLYFPRLATAVDLNNIRGQMTLFDTLASPVDEKRVVDVSHESFVHFFDVMEKVDYLAEAHAQRVEPVIFYIVGRTIDSYEQARLLRDRFACPFVVVDNAFLGGPNETTRHSQPYAALQLHPWRMQMPPLDPLMADVIADTGLSLAAFIREDVHTSSLAFLSREARPAIRAWIMAMFKEIHRILRSLEGRPQLLRVAGGE